jgi:mRNA-degrading endonuclease RelE of RelBE toxin-antitoxin system
VKPFALLIDSTVLEFLQGLKPREQPSLLVRLMQIRDYPENCTNWEERDQSGRLIRTLIRPDYTISFQIDDADRAVKIVEVRRR